MNPINKLRILAGLDPLKESSFAPQFDHSGYQQKVRGLSDESLRFIIRDAQEAIAANPESPKAKSGFYADEINYCTSELYRRSKMKRESVEEPSTPDPIQEIENKQIDKLLNLEGPFTLKNGKTVYLDVKEGRYYDKETDAYVNVVEGDIVNSTSKAANLDEAKEAVETVPTVKWETKPAFTSDEFGEVLKKAMNDVNSTHNDSDTAKLTKYKVPKDVIKACKDRIGEIQDAIAIDDDKGYNDHSQKVTAIEAIEQILQNISSGDQEGYKQAVIYYNGLSSSILHWLPNQLIKYLHQG